MSGDTFILPGRALPHSIEAEAAVLGAILCDNRAYERCAGLRPDHFALVEHRETFRVISGLIDAGKLADPVTVKSHLNGAVLDKGKFMLGLADAAVGRISAGEYARMIRELAIRREIIEACAEAESMAYSGDVGVDPVSVAAELLERLTGLLAGSESDHGVVSFADIPDDLPATKPIMGQWLCEQNTCMIHADKSVGKSMFAMSLAIAIARGDRFMGWSGSSPRRVVYADYEMAARDTRDRAHMLAGGKDKLPANLMLLHYELTTLRPISMPEGRMDVAANVRAGDVLILDNLLTAWDRSIGNNQWDGEIKDWSPVQRWLLDLRRKGICTIILHHDGKSGDQLGAHAKLTILNTVIHLKKPKDHNGDGCQIELNFRYSRTARGKDIQPLLAELRDGPNGECTWIWTPLSTSKDDGVVELAKLGMQPKDIATELGIGLATVYRLMKANGIETPHRKRAQK